MSQSPPKGPTSIVLRMGFQHMNVGGHKHSDYTSNTCPGFWGLGHGHLWGAVVLSNTAGLRGSGGDVLRTLLRPTIPGTSLYREAGLWTAGQALSRPVLLALQGSSHISRQALGLIDFSSVRSPTSSPGGDLGICVFNFHSH